VFGLTYLSNDKQKLLQKLEDRLTTASTPQLRNETLLAIQEIRVQAKPYLMCDLLEADDLRTQLLQKVSILSGLGKVGAVDSLRMYVKEVEFHIQTLQMKEALQEKEKLQTGEGPNLRDKSPSLNSVKKEKRRKEAFAQHRWMIGFEDEPDEENK
jgi:hypothetical protein